mmetsp:Transcript_34453/g.77689  ORF Transcript_34453/g.77689 Transcript_34453/m.77689 type:complete len:230 (-) Transcript_34453:854-1543(-)
MERFKTRPNAARESKGFVGVKSEHESKRNFNTARESMAVTVDEIMSREEFLPRGPHLTETRRSKLGNEESMIESEYGHEVLHDIPLRARESCVENKHVDEELVQYQHHDSPVGAPSHSLKTSDTFCNSFDSEILSVSESTLDSFCKVRSCINSIPDGHRRVEATKALETILQILEETGSMNESMNLHACPEDSHHSTCNLRAASHTMRSLPMSATAKFFLDRYLNQIEP